MAKVKIISFVQLHISLHLNILICFIDCSYYVLLIRNDSLVMNRELRVGSDRNGLCYCKVAHNRTKYVTQNIISYSKLHALFFIQKLCSQPNSTKFTWLPQFVLINSQMHNHQQDKQSINSKNC